MPGTDLNIFGPSPVIKICGVREFAHAAAAAEAGADFVAFLFAPSRRQVDAVIAGEIVASVRRQFGELSPRFIGVFVDEDDDTILRAVDTASLDVVQIHVLPSASTPRELPVPILSAISPVPGSSPRKIIESIRAMHHDQRRLLPVLLDAFDPDQFGGTGKLGDWTLAAAVAAELPVILAGGLSAENVATAIAQVRPFGVDVSSGVETDGRKDSRKITEFVKEARMAFDSIESG